MEITLYLLDAAITLLLLYWISRMGRRKRDTPISGMFAYRDLVPKAKVAVPVAKFVPNTRHRSRR